jgi:acyl carrier protein
MIVKKVIDIIANELSVSKEEIKLETRLKEDLNADSLNAIEVIMAIEEEFSITIPDDKASSLKAVGDIVKYIEANE